MQVSTGTFVPSEVEKRRKNLYGETSVNVNENWEDAFVARVGIFPISGREKRY